MRRTFLIAICVVGLVGSVAQAQIIGPGSSLAGDYMRGAGIAAWGMGSYNLNTAQANSINLDTAIRFNEYVAAVVKEQTREYVARKTAEAAKLKEFYKQHRQKLLESPEARDVLNADALNRLLEEIYDRNVGDSTMRNSQFRVQLAADVVRKIPFKLSEKGERFSLDRLWLKGKDTWTVALQDERFKLHKAAYERALVKALEQAIDGRMQIATIENLEAAADEFLRKLDEVVGPSSDRLYTEAVERLRELKTTVRLLKTQKVELAIAELDKYSGTSVADLIDFMQRHNLRFAAAGTLDERKLLPELYASLKEQSEKVAIPTN